MIGKPKQLLASKNPVQIEKVKDANDASPQLDEQEKLNAQF